MKTGLLAGFFVSATAQTPVAQTVLVSSILKEASAETVGMSTT